MKNKLTIKTVGSLKPKNKIYDVYDTEIPGFVLRVRPSGLMTYLYFYRNKDGKKRTHTIGRGLTAIQARDIAKQRNAEVAQGIDINERDSKIKDAAKKAKSNTLNSFLSEVYKPWLIENRKSGQDAYERLNRSFPTLANHQLDEITPWDIEVWRKQRRKDGTSDHTIKRDLAELKSMIGRAQVWGAINSNPLQNFKYGKLEDNKVVRYLSDSERSRLYAALDKRETKQREKRAKGNQWRKARDYELLSDYSDSSLVDYVKPLITLALNTGLRRGELLNLKWSDVNLNLKQISVTSSSAKSKKARYVPLNESTHAVMNQWYGQRKNSPYVFPNSNGQPFTNVRKSWASVLKLAEIENFRFHDMRHDFASQLVMKGVELYVVKELLGHSTIQVTERYAHLAPKQLEDAVNLLNK